MKKALLLLPLSLLIITSCNDNSSNYMPIDSQSSYSDLVEIDSSLYTKKLVGVNYSEVTEVTYHSNVTGFDKHATVYLPYGYSKDNKYPVLYLLHGMFGSHYSWFNDCKADVIISNAITLLEASEMIVVGVNSIVNEGEEEPSIVSSEFTEVYDLTGRELVESLMPHINENYSTLTDKNHTALAGYSMGGRETLLTAFNYQDYFGYIGAFSSASFNKNIISTGEQDPVLSEFKIDDESSGFRYILLSVGSSDMMTSGHTQRYSSMMDASNIEHEFKIYSGGHNYPVWQESLLYFARHLFNC